MKILDIPLENRPRERMKLIGSHALSDAEILAIILQKGIKGENVVDLSNKLIFQFGLENLKNLSINELKSINGIGEAKALQIKAIFEINKRIKMGKICETIIKNSKDIINYYSHKLSDKKKEFFIAVFLDSKNKIISDKIISIGTLNSALVHPREVFKEAIKVSANSLILVHNHPSKDKTPSDEDLKVTEMFTKAGDIIGIKLLDHIIV